MGEFIFRSVILSSSVTRLHNSGASGSYAWRLRRRRLGDFTEKVTISFIDLYPKIAGSIRGKDVHELSHGQKEALAESFAGIAHAR